jgi:hypothetical protein
MWSNVRAALDSGPELAYYRQVLAESTSAGFGAMNGGTEPAGVPASLHCPLPESLAWIRRDDRIVIGANGSVIDAFGECDHWEALLADLKAGTPVPTSNLLRLVPVASHEKWLRFIANANLAVVE